MELGYLMSTIQLAEINAVPGPWNKSRLVGQKRPVLSKQVQAIRARLELAHRFPFWAMLSLVLDSKLRGCGFVRLKVTKLVIGKSFANDSGLCRAKQCDLYRSSSMKIRGIPSGIGFACLQCADLLSLSLPSPSEPPFTYAPICLTDM